MVSMKLEERTGHIFGNVFNDLVSTAVQCWNSMENLTNGTIVREATSSECKFARFAGLSLLIIALGSLIVNVRFLGMASKHCRLSRRDRGLVVGMFISSLSIIIISIPSVVVQCLYCRRLCIPVLCRIEGFNSFLNGCAAIYMLVALSMVRYATTAKSSVSIHLQRRLEQHGFYLVLMCFIMSGAWAIPPLFGHMSSYAPEGLGFHCGLDWFDRSLPSRIYFFLLFLSVFFLPIIIVIYVNIYIQRTVYRLTHLQPAVLLELCPVSTEERMRRHLSYSLFIKQSRRLNRLRDDRHFVIATGISVVVYFIAWTPYSLVAIGQVFGDQFSLYHPWLMTTCAVLAKLSMITNPMIFMVTLESRDVPSKR